MRLIRAAFVAIWPILAVIALTSIIVAGVLTWITTLEQRDRLITQTEQVEELVRAQREESRSLAERTERQRQESAERLAGALVEVERITEERYDALVAQIAVLLDRPAGVPVDPVTARGVPGANPTPQPAPTTSAPSTTPAPAPRSTPPTSSPRTTAAPAPPPAPTTTTTPDQKSCEKNPDGPRC